MQRRQVDVLVRILRIAVVCLVVSAEVSLIVILGDRFDAGNHYSYFTVLSNVFGAAVLGVGLFRPVPDAIRGAAVTYLATTGVVYALLLRGVDVQTPGYANIALHVAVPVLVVVEWLLMPPRESLQRRVVLAWLAAPVAYLAYTLLRGPVADWYPYPFLDPRPTGYGQVALWCLVVAATIAAIALAVRATGEVGRRREARRISMAEPGRTGEEMMPT